jgi:NTE family protein
VVRPKLAFVGSGGATKGIAHLGVLKALEEIGIRPDIHVGTSSGALAAAFFAQGVGSEEMMDWLRPRWRRSTSRGIKGRAFLGLPRGEELRSPGRLTSGLLSIDRFERHLENELPMNDFRQLDTTLLVTATDIDGKGRTVFGRGHREDVPISQAVAASCCVPLLFRPYRIDDRYYLDGELVRTLSIDLAVDAGADIVVVSNVYRPHFDGGPSIASEGPMAIARQALNILLSEKEARGIELLAERYPRVTILNVSPDLGAFSFTSRRNARKLLLRGYREGLRVLVAAKRRGLLDGDRIGPAVGQA